MRAGHFKLQGEPKLPVVAFSLDKPRAYDEYDIMYRIRCGCLHLCGWLVP
jgi:hypothetical protein